ncbi:MAG: glycerol dehydratase [Epulopiscium sp.]|nr:glycerol dehydratase [Candidatus Epulonipiscium sp.]
MNKTKPQIIILTYDANPIALKEVIAGIEEEGVLWDVEEVQEYKNLWDLATEASRKSSLEVGIGIYKDEAAVQCRELIGREPLFKTDDAYRLMGSNAGRYVKRNPFIFEDR